MKKMVGFLSLSFLFIMTGCSNNNQEESSALSSNSTEASSTESSQQLTADSSITTSETEHNNVAIVYYTLTGTTEAVANEIQAQTNGDLYAIETVEAYPDEYADVAELVRQQQTAGEFPELQPLAIDLSAYDTLYLGSPIWFGSSSLPLQEWLSQNDLSKKTILPFLTSGSSGIDNAVSEIESLAMGAEVRRGLGITDDAVGDVSNLVAAWLTGN